MVREARTLSNEPSSSAMLRWRASWPITTEPLPKLFRIFSSEMLRNLATLPMNCASRASSSALIVLIPSSVRGSGRLALALEETIS